MMKTRRRMRIRRKDLAKVYGERRRDHSANSTPTGLCKGRDRLRIGEAVARGRGVGVAIVAGARDRREVIEETTVRAVGG